MISWAVNVFADIIEWSARSIRQAKKDFESAKVRARRSRDF